MGAYAISTDNGVPMLVPTADAGVYQRGADPMYAQRAVASKLSDQADIRDWSGIDLTGSNDSASAVQAAINAMAATGQPLHFPPGLIALDSTIMWPENSHIVGSGQAGWFYDATHTWFKFTHAGIGLHAQAAAVQEGPRSIRGINTHREQGIPASGWTPGDFDFDVSIEGASDVWMNDLMLYNPTKGIETRYRTLDGGSTAFGVGRVHLRNIKGTPICIGLQLTNCYDVCFVDEIEFYQFWLFNQPWYQYVADYIHNNGIAFHFGRVDGPMCGRLFSYGYSSGLRLYQEVDGPTGAAGGSVNQGHVEFLYSDDTFGPGFQVDADSASLSIGRAVLGGHITGSNSIDYWLATIGGSNARMHIGALETFYSNKGAIYLGNPGSVVTVGNSRSAHLDYASQGSPEFYANAGTTLQMLSVPTTSARVVYAGPGTKLENSGTLK